jgi:hypothetical protein
MPSWVSTCCLCSRRVSSGYTVTLLKFEQLAAQVSQLLVGGECCRRHFTRFVDSHALGTQSIDEAETEGWRVG